ncbi:MAG: hypothetical protein SGPRY_003521, partial [Prymnesium sp.]
VSSVSRSGAPSSLGPELSSVEWLSADIERPEQLEQAMRGVDGVVSCVGVFGSNEYMRRINGQANATAVEAAAKAGVRRFAYISAQKFRPVAMVAPGYFEGKEMAEEAVGRHFGSDGCVLRPPAIYGTREVGKYLKLPLGVVSRGLFKQCTLDSRFQEEWKACLLVGGECEFWHLKLVFPCF